MSRIYDNWEKLVAAAVKKQQLWELFHEQSRSPSLSSESSSGFSFSFWVSSSLDDLDFSSSSVEDSAAGDPLNGLVEEQSPDVQLISRESPVQVKKVYSKSPRRRDLVIQVPDLCTQYQNAFGHILDSLKISPNGTPNPVPNSTPIHRRGRGGRQETPKNWSNDEKHGSHPLPLPPKRVSDSAANSPPSAVPCSPGRVGNLASPGSPWKRGKLLNGDAFGYVYVCFNSETGEMCAMKEVMLFTDDAKSKKFAKKLEQEIAVLSSLSHPNIVQYYGSETVDEKLYVCLEYVSGGTVHKILKEYGRLGESAIRTYTKQILLGLAYLHSKNTVHRDIKGASILFDPNGSVKLANFGIAKHITSQFDLLSFEGSPYWMAPEVVMNPNGCSLAVDIWSLGCTVLEMATSKPPWSKYEKGVALFKIGNSKELPSIPDHLSEEGKQFVRLCLQRNPLSRPTAAQLLEHPFVKYNIHASDMYSPRNIGHGVSPVVSPALNEKMSPSPLSSSRTRSRQSTAQTGVILHHHLNQSLISPESSYKMPKLLPSPCSNSPTYWDPDILRGLQSGYRAVIHKHTYCDNERQRTLPHDRHSLLADRVSLGIL